MRIQLTQHTHTHTNALALWRAHHKLKNSLTHKHSGGLENKSGTSKFRATPADRTTTPSSQLGCWGRIDTTQKRGGGGVFDVCVRDDCVLDPANEIEQIHAREELVFLDCAERADD